MENVQKFLDENRFLAERVNFGIDVHPSKIVSETFEDLARQLAPKKDFSWRGCQSCINALVKYVYDNESRVITRVAKMKFPKQDAGEETLKA